MADTMAEALRQVEGMEDNKIGCSDKYINEKIDELSDKLKTIVRSHDKEVRQKTEAEATTDKDAKLEALKGSIKVIGHINTQAGTDAPLKSQKERLAEMVEYMANTGKKRENIRMKVIEHNETVRRKDKKHIPELLESLTKSAEKQMKNMRDIFPKSAGFTKETLEAFSSVLLTAGFMGAGLENNFSEKSIDILFQYMDETPERKDALFKMLEGKLNKEDIDFCMGHKEWNGEQLEQAYLGAKHDLKQKDIEWYMKSNFSLFMKKEMRIGLEEGLNKGQIFSYMKKNLSHEQITILRNALKRGVNEKVIDNIAKRGLSFNQLKETLKGVDENTVIEKSVTIPKPEEERKMKAEEENISRAQKALLKINVGRVNEALDRKNDDNIKSIKNSEIKISKMQKEETTKDAATTEEKIKALQKNIDNGLPEATAWKMLEQDLSISQINDLSKKFIDENKKEEQTSDERNEEITEPEKSVGEAR